MAFIFKLFSMIDISSSILPHIANAFTAFKNPTLKSTS